MTSEWRKVLYSRGFADNFTPTAFFLEAIERNKNLHKYSLSNCIQAGILVSLQFSLVLAFCICYLALEARYFSSITLLISEAIVVVAFLVIGNTIKIKQVVIFVLFGLGLSPIFLTLTDTISTDTIHTAVGFMLLVHLIFFNYGLEGAVVSDSLSLNAGLFAAVCLASRLPHSLDGFVLMCLAVELFSLIPLYKRRAQKNFRFWTMSFVVIALINSASFKLMPYPMAFLAFAMTFSLSFVFPLLFYRWQSFKDTIHGPWDEAVPAIDDHDEE